MSSQIHRDLQHWRSKSSGFSGGVNINAPPNLMSPDQLVRSQNVTIESAGGLAKRLGTLAMGTYSGDPTEFGISCYTFYLDPPDVPQLIVQTNKGKLYFSYDGVTWSPIIYYGSGGGGPVPVSTTQPCSFETVDSILYFVDGEHGLRGWDGGGTHNIPDAPAHAKYIRLWQDILWASGDVDLADRVWGSATGDPTAWPIANFVDILRGDNDQVMGLFSDGQFLVVGKLRRMQVIFDSTQLLNRTADYEKGLESHWSVIHYGDNLFYLSRLGVCEWQGDSAAIVISYNIDRLFRPDMLNYTKMQYSWAYFINDRVGWLLPEVGSDVNSLAIEYYPRYGHLYQLSGRIGPGPFMFHRLVTPTLTTMRGAITDQFPNNTESLFGPHASQNRFCEVFAPNTGDDLGVAFSSEVQIAYFDMGEPIYTKSLRRMRVFGRGKFVLELRRNYQNDIYRVVAVDLDTDMDESSDWDVGTTWGDEDWPAVTTMQSKILNFDAVGRSFSISIRDFNPEAGEELKTIAGRDTLIPAGRWALYELGYEGFLLGLRG